MYDEPPPEDVSAIKGIYVGDGKIAKAARIATKAANDVNRILDKLDPLP